MKHELKNTHISQRLPNIKMWISYFFHFFFSFFFQFVDYFLHMLIAFRYLNMRQMCLVGCLHVCLYFIIIQTAPKAERKKKKTSFK